MKVKDLLEEIKRGEKDYPDFLEWEVYTEQLYEEDKQAKRANPQWKWVKDSEDWEYIECAGFWTRFPDGKIFTINVNY